jgi:hypothetical protein
MTDDRRMDLPKYPAGTPVKMPDDSVPRQIATALLGGEAILFMLFLPVHALLLLGTGFDVMDPGPKARVADFVVPSGAVTLGTAVLLFFATSSVSRDARDQVALTAVGAALGLFLSVGWLWVWRGGLVSDPVFGGSWLVLSAPVPIAWLLVRRLARRRGDSESGQARTGRADRS